MILRSERNHQISYFRLFSRNEPIRGMRFSILLILFNVILTLHSLAQTTILIDSGPGPYTNIDGTILDDYDVDISDCSSVQFSVGFSFNLPWEGTGGMEFCTECIGGCACDPSNPGSQGCATPVPCWDFMWMQFFIGGQLEDENLIGDADTDNSENFGIYMTPLFCTEDESTATIEITNQNWAMDETNEFSNVTLICWEGTTTVTASNPVCLGGDIQLTSTSTDAISWSWEGPAGFTSSLQNPLVTGSDLPTIPDDYIYSLTISDSNGCMSTDEVEITIEEPVETDLDAIDLNPCEGVDIELEEIGGEASSWSWTGPEGFFSTSQFPIVMPPNLPDAGTHTYVVIVTDSGGCTGTGEIEIMVETVPNAEADADQTLICENVDILLEEEGGDADVWLWEGPNGFTSTLQDPIVTGSDLPSIGTHTYNVTITDFNGCTQTSFVDIEITPAPTAQASATSATVCAGQNIELQEISNVFNTYTWTGPMGYTSNVQNPIISGSDIPGIGTHTYTVNAIDASGCMDTDEIEITVNATVTATLTTPAGGDVIVCDGECATTEYIVELELTGGVAPYTVDIGIVGVPIPIPLPAIDVNQTFIQICNGPIGFDFNSDPLQITLPDFAFGTSLEITNVVDSGGCTGSISGGNVSLILMDNPSIQSPNVMPECLQPGESIDLTQYDAEIGNGLDVLWLRTEDEDDLINSPETYDTNEGEMVYAVVSDDPCFSEIIPVQLEILFQPVITIEMPVIDVCGNELELPPINDVASIDFEVSPQYYQDNDFSVPGQNPSSVIIIPDGSSTIYLYDQSSDECFDAQPIEVISNPQPEILSPSGTISECGSIILPDPVIINDNDIDFEYNTEPDGSGRSFSEDDEIEATDGIDMLFLIATNRGGSIDCIDTTQIRLEFLSGVNFSAIIPSQICDTLILPAISPASPTAGFYTDIINGDIFLPGDTISYEEANATSDILDTLFLFDPTQSGVCATVDTIVFEIGQSPRLDIVIQRQFCEAGTLPLPDSNNPNLQYSTNRDFLPGTILDPSTSITSSTQIFYRDSIAFQSGGGCFAIDSFELEIITPPNAGQNNEVNLCQGTNLIIDLFELLGSPDQNGQFSTPIVVPDLDFSNPSQVDLSVLLAGNYSIDYNIEVAGCPISSSSLIVNVSSLPFTGTPFDETICRIATDVDLTQLLTDEEIGGDWFYSTTQQTMRPITEPTIFDVSNIQDDVISIIYSVASDNPNEICDGAMTVSTLRLTDAPNAGLDGASTICMGQTVDLNTIISADADAGGTFFQDGFDVPDPTNWLPLTINQNVIITYIIESNLGVCPSDTATIDITISDILTAGTPLFDENVCENIPIFLSDRLDGESPGGTFFLASDLSIPLPDEWIPSSNETFIYITPEATGCDPDTSTFSIEVNEAPIITCTLSSMDLCSDSQECVDLELSSNKDGQLILEILNDPTSQERIDLDVVLSPGSSILRLCPSATFNEPPSTSDSLFIGSSGEIMVNTISFEEDFGICPTIPLNQQHLISIRNEFLLEIDTTVCDGNSIELAGEFFSRDTIINAFTTFGCDSTIIININEELATTVDVTRQLCDGQLFDEIDGFSFTSNIDTIIILEGEAETGCDSIINLNLDFQDITIGMLTPTLCEGESLEIDGVVINATNPNADILSPVMSVFGCDSVTNVMAVFLPLPIVGSESLTLCPDESQTIGDITYDINTTSGTSLLTNGSAVGCDSMVNVTVNIVQEIFDMSFDLCANDSLTIGNDIYTASNITGMSNTGMLSSLGCDSILNVNINVLDLDERMINLERCEDFIFVIGNDIFDFENPSGMAAVSNPSGCDSLFIINIIELRKDEINLELAFCEDRDTMINGTIYNAGNTMGQAVLMNEFGCDSTVIVNLFVGSTSATIMTNICPGENSGTLELMSTEGLTLPLSLDIPSASISVVVNNLPFVIDLPVGNHEVLLDDGECTYAETILLSETIEPVINVTADTLSDNSWQLSVDSDQNIVDYNWQTSAEIDCNNCPSPVITSDLQTSVSIEIATDTGCTFTSSIDLSPVGNTFEQDSIVKIFFPTALLLSDSQNDRFVIRSNINLEIDRLSIYDRWGNLIFNNENFLTDIVEEGWDGRRNGVEIEQGVYVFLIEYEDPVFGPEILHGSITIIR